jgi:hypothetical protein
MVISTNIRVNRGLGDWREMEGSTLDVEGSIRGLGVTVLEKPT